MIIATILTTFSCSTKLDDKVEPVRLQNIPEKAFWVGGTDGGNWFLVEDVHNHSNNATIKVYNDIDGSLIASKRFMLICPVDNHQPIHDLQEQINGFDGKKILLKSPNTKKACWLQ
jgi:hypothetical protein